MIFLKGGVLIITSLTIISSLLILLITVLILNNQRRNQFEEVLKNQRKFLFGYVRLEEKLISELKIKTANESDIKTLKNKYRKEVLSENDGLFELQFPKGTHVENIESQIRKEISRLYN